MSLNVSVVMCTFNGAAFIKEQLESILQQTHPPTEILIFDDCSTDDTFPLLLQLQQKHTGISCFQNAVRLGFTKNFEQAILQAKEDVIAIADQDDIWLPTKIADLLAAWQPNSPIIYCDSQRFSGTPPAKAQPAKNYNRFHGTNAEKLFFFNTVSGHALLIKKWFLPYILPFENGIYYDWQMAVTACQHGGVQYLAKTLVLQRVHGNNESIDKQDNKESFLRYRLQVSHHLYHFVKQNLLSPNSQIFAHYLAKFLANSSPSFTTKLQAFFRILSHANHLFQYKKRKFPYFSYIKHAYKWSFT